MGVNLPATSDSPVMFPSGFISPNSTAPANVELTQGTLGMEAFRAEPVPADALKCHEENGTPSVVADTDISSTSPLSSPLPDQEALSPQQEQEALKDPPVYPSQMPDVPMEPDPA